MKVYRDLMIRLNSVQVPELLACLERHASAGWRRDTVTESRIQAITPRGGGRFCFVLDGDARFSPASLWLTAKDPDHLCVANILSERKGDLTPEEYNTLLDHFYRSVARPAADACGATVELGKDEVLLADFAHPDTVAKLRLFSSAANKSTAAAHPQDRQRWLDFITDAHRQGARLPAHVLSRWLQEEEHWPSDAAYELAEEYEFARQLLAAYDHKRAG